MSEGEIIGLRRDAEAGLAGIGRAGAGPARLGKRGLILVISLGVISVLHWLTPVGGSFLHLIHILLRKLFILPVVLGGIWFGLRGGLATAALATLLYSPFVVLRWGGQASENLNQAGEVFSLWVIAIVAGYLAGREMRLLGASAVAAHLESERLEGVVDAAGVGMMQVGADTSLHWFSGRIAEWFGWNADQVHATCPLLGAEPGCERCVVRECFETGQAGATERKVVAESGGERYFRHSSSPVRDAAGVVVQVVEVIEDVTARRALEAEAIRAGKLSVLGRMAAGIAHEIGNPLSSIATRLSLLERRRDADFVGLSVGLLRAQIDRISRIVHGITSFARAGRKDRSRWQVDRLAEETIEVVALDRRAKGIRFERAFETPSPRVRAVRDQMAQVLLNLLLNAVEAMPEGGVVEVECASREGEAVLVVSDRGEGISEQARSHLFEPFFTTKPEGTGLGLSVSYGLAAAHGGRIEARNRPDGGARFALVLPLDETADESAAATDRGGRERA